MGTLFLALALDRRDRPDAEAREDAREDAREPLTLDGAVFVDDDSVFEDDDSDYEVPFSGDVIPDVE